MYGVEVGCILGVVKVKHSTQPHDRQHQGKEHQCRMKELPREFILTPGQRDAVQHSSCSEEAKRLKMVCLIKCDGHIKSCCCLITASAPDASTQGSAGCHILSWLKTRVPYTKSLKTWSQNEKKKNPLKAASKSESIPTGSS